MNKADQNKREWQWTGKRIEYNNAWPDCGMWHSDIQIEFDNWLKQQSLSQIFEVVKLSDTAHQVLYDNAKLNKLFSGILDIYDELPYRPDEAFDIAWRSLEIFMNHHRSVAWKADGDRTVPHLIERTVKDLVLPLVQKDKRFEGVLEGYLGNLPLSVLVFTILRCYIIHDLSINTQIKKVSERAEDVLTKDLYDDIKIQYKLEQDVKPAVDVLRNAALLLQLILKGREVTVNKHKYQLGLEKRLEFLLSCVLYTSRCERFHGDYFSPFKSDRADLDTYAFSYFLLSFCYIYLLALIHRHCELNNIGEICSLDSILDAAKTMQDRMKPLIAKGK